MKAAYRELTVAKKETVLLSTKLRLAQSNNNFKPYL